MHFPVRRRPGPARHERAPWERGRPARSGPQAHLSMGRDARAFVSP